MPRLASLLALVLFASASATGAQERPNVLFLLSDDQRADTIAAFGDLDCPTPHLDALAARGTVFPRAYCMGSDNGAVCVPSRAMILTGKSLWRCRDWDADTLTMPQAFAAAGYRTYGIGKWHNGKDRFQRTFEDGGTIFFGGMGSHTTLPVQDYDPSGAYPKEARRPLNALSSTAFSSTAFADEAIGFLERTATEDDGRPFFCWVAFTAPHDPRTPPEEHRVDPSTLDLPPAYRPIHPFDNGEMVVRDERLAPWPRTPDEARRHLADYLGMVSQLDGQVGRILAALEATGQAENTIVVFASDHGLAIGSHGLLGKQNVYEHSMRAPLILAGPGVEAGARNDGLAYLLDSFRTLAALAGLPVPDGVEGRDLLDPTLPPRETLYTAYKSDQKAVRDGRWKLIRYPNIDKTQLFDLEKDPHETQDRFGPELYDDLVERLMGALAEHQAATGDPHPLEVAKPRPAAFRPPPPKGQSQRPPAKNPPATYEPSWDSLSKHPAPAWFDDAVLGIFIHWGVYSVPAYCDTSTYSEWYRHWVDTGAHDGFERRFHAEQYGADFPYEGFAPMFRAELFDADQWADVFRRAGADYVVLTSKHHDGYALWPSAEASAARGHPWNSVEVGPQRDLVGELSRAVRDVGLRMGLYYSFLEWHNPVFDGDLDAYVEEVMFPQVKELVSTYEPAIFWPDGEWTEPDTTWRSEELLAWIYNNAPNQDEILVNDRWGAGLRGLTGDYYTTEYGLHGGAHATTGVRPWEECRGIGGSFAFNRAEGYDDYMSRDEVVELLVRTVARGGKLLLDVGPTADGRIPLIMQDRLFALGRWMERYGSTLRGADPTPFPSPAHEPWGATTVKGDRMYLHLFDWPTGGELQVDRLATEVLGARLLSDPDGRSLEVSDAWPSGVKVSLAGLHPAEHVSVIELTLAGPPEVDERIHAQHGNTLVLHAAEAKLFGEGLRLEPSGVGSMPEVPSSALAPASNLGFWTHPRSGAMWRMIPPSSVGCDVRIVYACADGQEGSRMRLTIGDTSREFVVERSTGGWQDYATIELPGFWEWEGDPSYIQLECLDVAAGAALNLRAVILDGMW